MLYAKLKKGKCWGVAEITEERRDLSDDAEYLRRQIYSYVGKKPKKKNPEYYREFELGVKFDDFQNTSYIFDEYLLVPNIRVISSRR